ncbi:MAG: hypothetical protein M0Q98_14430 [Pseudomonas sp.]|jgi:hypothetical protein|nr:hypothetical protein [Pseudomonas sp.]MDY0413321.1 hypothetical protein [Pseudomonas sp.]
MKVFVNDKKVVIFHGAKVVDVVRAYYVKYDKKLPSSMPVVRDAYGNSIALDGELKDENRLYIPS